MKKDTLNRMYGTARQGRKIMIRLYYRNGSVKELYARSYNFRDNINVMYYYDIDLSNGLCPKSITGTIFLDNVERFEIIERIEEV